MCVAVAKFYQSYWVRRDGRFALGGVRDSVLHYGWARSRCTAWSYFLAVKRRIRHKARGAFERIWAVVRPIPRGQVATYGQVAALAGLPGHARLAGYALHASPAEALPWHRVVNAEGRLSLARTNPSGGLTQRLRLGREGVSFDARGRVDVALHRWDPRRARRRRRVRGRPGPEQELIDLGSARTAEPGTLKRRRSECA